MDLSPNDIRNFEFRSQMRGYDKDEVDTLLDQASAALEEKSQHILKLKMEIESITGQLTGLKQYEETIKGAAIDARRNADMTVATAKQEAAMLLSKAKAESQDLMASRTRDVSEIEAQITKLGLTKKSYLAKIRTLVKSHLEMLDQFDEAPLHDSRDTLEVTDSADVTVEAREMNVEPESDSPDDDEDNDMVDGGTRTDLEESRPGTAHAEPAKAEAGPIDPELAAALENYQTGPQATAGEALPKPASEPAPYNPRSIVETNALAEDVPEGFIARDSDGGDPSSSTDRVKVNPLKNDAGESEQGNKEFDPATIGENLDQVAAKFEEEMDRAQKS